MEATQKSLLKVSDSSSFLIKLLGRKLSKQHSNFSGPRDISIELS
jgi:hypothetical protein